MLLKARLPYKCNVMGITFMIELKIFNYLLEIGISVFSFQKCIVPCVIFEGLRIHEMPKHTASEDSPRSSMGVQNSFIYTSNPLKIWCQVVPGNL